MGILILLIEFVNMIVLLSLTVILIFQIYGILHLVSFSLVKKESSRANLDMKDPDAMIDTNLLRGMLHLFSHKIAEWTKDD